MFKLAGVKPLIFNPRIDTTRVKQNNVMRRQKMCRRKKAYSTKIYALIIAAKCRDKQQAQDLRAYQCPYCHQWHLTKQLESNKQ